MELLQDTGYAAAFGAEDVSSGPMRRSILRWLELYYGRNPGGQDGCLQLPYTIVRKLSRAIFAEYAANEALSALPCREAMELALIGGESYLKPVVGDTVRWRAISRGNILIFGRDLWGEPRDVGLMEKSLLGRQYYTLLERRTLDENGLLTVTNRLFRSQSRGSIGREVPLKAHPAYASLPARYTFRQSLGGVGLVRLKMPMANCIDGSREGVSIYAPAVQLLEAIGENEAQLRKEFSNGASRLVVSRDLLTAGQLKDDVFVALDESPETVGITVFAPQLREQSYLNRQQAYLRSVENIIGLKRGLLSQVEAVDRTATEITSSEGEYMSAIWELRQVWEKAAAEALALESRLTGRAAEQPAITWGDGIL
jgi:hypothetical protein